MSLQLGVGHTVPIGLIQ